MQISVVIPTRNRKDRLMALLECLRRSALPLYEIIIVDASDVPFTATDHAPQAPGPDIICIPAEASVCIQRNIGIRAASSPWVFICDDDIEVPEDYLVKISGHMDRHPEAGAVSGLVLQREQGVWTSSYPLTSAKELVLKYIFGLGIWGEIRCASEHFLVRKARNYYTRKGNHLSKAGWPVITAPGGAFWTTPVYGLGASVIKTEWLLASPYDEVLDRHGIGDNYGVAIGFPAPVQVVNDAFVYHHQETENRLLKPLQYYRRVLALDYFIRKGRTPATVGRRWLLWSLLGNLLVFMLSKDKLMIAPARKAIAKVLWGKNPYLEADKRQQKITEPLL